MYLKSIRISNFRRLSDVRVDLDSDISIFVGANNSGKTSVAHAMDIFLDRGERVSFYDISACRWADIEAFAQEEEGASLPVMSLDLWFHVEVDDLYRVIDLLPSLDWKGTHVGVRIAFVPKTEDEILARFRKWREHAQESAGDAQVPESAEPHVALPPTLTEYLELEIMREYEFKYFVLDAAQFNDEFQPNKGYDPLELLGDQGGRARKIIKSLIRVDFLYAQRHLSDSAGSRAKELSQHLSRYYTRNLERHAENFNITRALAKSKLQLNRHLEQVFAETLERLAQLGYPGFANPRLMIKSALNPATVMSSQEGASVHYALNDEGLTLPDKYNGLGFKNLIYMVVELLGLHAQWQAIEDNRPPLHMVFVEEPEAHLHVQLQQVFVNKILNILVEEEDEPSTFRTQLALTTHSPHILYEHGFKAIRYFRRENTGVEQSSCVLNLSEFYEATKNSCRDFLERYLKLTHCDLFFADAAVLVEGNVERLLMPQMIVKAAPGLRSTYLSVIEIGGAFGHRFRTLIEFIGITALIITDLDSVCGPKGKTCPPENPHAFTSNQTLRRWLPRKERIDELLGLGPDDKLLPAGEDRKGAVRVTYPSMVELVRDDERIERAGRTFEVAFAFENLKWTQKQDNRDLKLHVHGAHDKNIEYLALQLHEKVHKSSFRKTDFALALLAKNPDKWIVPRYISEALKWLEAALGVAPVAEKPAEDEGA